MDPDSPIPPSKPSRPEPANSTVPEKVSSPSDSSSFLSPSAISSWAKGLKLTQPLAPANNNSSTENAVKSAFSRLTSGFGVSSPSKSPGSDGSTVGNPSAPQSSVFESFTKGVVDTSMGAVKAVQVKARHIVSQNKRRYQEGGFDLDMTYITENIIAMGFPAGDKSSGFFSFVEGFYRNHMEEVIKFFETHHKGKYKVYNLCSERLYDAALFEGKVASFPFDDHNCPPINLIKLFCQSAYSWLKEDILNVVVVHCKAGKARTGLMICSLLLFLKFFPTAEECIDYYNQRRCVDGKGLILPSQIRYVKYFERIQMQFNGETPPGRRCMMRGFRLHKCPYWVRPSITISNHNGVLFTTKKHPKTKDLMPEDFWLRSAKKGIVIFALPGEPGLTELVGDFKIHFHDRQGDFYCWLNTTMMENRSILNGSDLDGFDKRKLPSPGFQVEIVMIDYNGIVTQKFKNTDDATTSNNPPPHHHHDESSNPSPSTDKPNINHQDQQQQPPLPIPSKPDDNENVFSDSDGEEEEDTETETTQQKNTMVHESGSSTTATTTTGLTHQTEQLSLNANRESSSSSSVVPVTTTAGGGGVDSGKSVKEMELSSTSSSSIPNLASGDIKAIAADASVFSFGDDDDEDYESE